MTYLIRFILICIIIYLLVRSFVRFFSDQDNRKSRRMDYENNRKKPGGVSKEIGEYVDYEEVDD